MALTLVVEDGSSKTDSNTYISLDDADTYFEGRLNATAWTGADDPTKKAGLVQAARILDQYILWLGWVSDSDQAMSWPRAGIFYAGSGQYYASYDIHLAESVYSIADDSIPQKIKDAQCELALVLISQDTQALPGTAGFKSIGVAGAVDLEIDKYDRTKEIPAHVFKIVSHLGSRKGGATRLARC
jgi:hypothetical protein